MKCEKCNRPKANKYINGFLVCDWCFLGIKHSSLIGFKKELMKSDNTTAFFEYHTELLKFDYFGNKLLDNTKIKQWLKKLK